MLTPFTAVCWNWRRRDTLLGGKRIGSLQRSTRRPARSFTFTPSSCSGRLARIRTGSDFDGLSGHSGYGLLWLLPVLPFGQPVARRSLIQNPESKIQNYSTCWRFSALPTPFTKTTLWLITSRLVISDSTK